MSSSHWALTIETWLVLPSLFRRTAVWDETISQSTSIRSSFSLGSSDIILTPRFAKKTHEAGRLIKAVIILINQVAKKVAWSIDTIGEAKRISFKIRRRECWLTFHIFVDQSTLASAVFDQDRLPGCSAMSCAWRVCLGGSIPDQPSHVFLNDEWNQNYPLQITLVKAIQEKLKISWWRDGTLEQVVR